MFKRKMRLGKYARVRMDHVEVSVSNNFEFLLELRYKLEKLCDTEIERDEKCR